MPHPAPLPCARSLSVRPAADLLRPEDTLSKLQDVLAKRSSLAFQIRQGEPSNLGCIVRGHRGPSASLARYFADGRDRPMKDLLAN